MVRVLQINLHHSKAASAALLLRLHDGGEDIILVQEPWVLNHRVLGLNITGYQLITPHGNGKKRACILIKNDIHHFLLNHFSHNDILAVAISLANQTYWIASCYMPYEETSPPDTTIRQLMNEANSKGLPVIIGADANAHNEM